MTARRGPMRRDVDKAAARAGLGELDAAALQLARHYATCIDDARFWADQARLAAVELGDAPERGDERRIQAVEKAVDSYRVMANLGPKLLATLAALGLTGSAKRATPATDGSAGGDDPQRAKLIALRDRRRRAG